SVFLSSFGEWFVGFVATKSSASGNCRGSSPRLRYPWRMIGFMFTLLCAVSLVAQTAGSPSVPTTAAPDNTDQASSPNPKTQSDSAQPTTTPAQIGQDTPAATLEGKVKSGNTPIPGAMVGATNPVTGQKIVAWTRLDGSYKLALPAAGEYVVRVQMAGFAVATQHVTVTPANLHPHLDLQITLLSRAQSANPGAYARGGGAGNRGFQALSVLAAEARAGNGGAENSDSVAPSGMPVPCIPPSMATES